MSEVIFKLRVSNTYKVTIIEQDGAYIKVVKTGNATKVEQLTEKEVKKYIDDEIKNLKSYVPCILSENEVVFEVDFTSIWVNINYINKAKYLRLICAFHVNNEETRIYKLYDGSYILTINYEIAEGLTDREVIDYVNNTLLKDFIEVKKQQVLKILYEVMDIRYTNQTNVVIRKSFLFNKYFFDIYEAIR